MKEAGAIRVFVDVILGRRFGGAALAELIDHARPGDRLSLEITSTEPIVTLSLNFEADPVFSSLPPGELDAAAQGSTSSSQGPMRATSTTAYR